MNKFLKKPIMRCLSLDDIWDCQLLGSNEDYVKVSSDLSEIEIKNVLKSIKKNNFESSDMWDRV